MPKTDDGVIRVEKVEDLSMAALICGMKGHNWSEPRTKRRKDGDWDWKYECDCGRRKRELVYRNGVKHPAVEYTGGELCYYVHDRKELRLEYLRRQRTALVAVPS